MGDYNKAIEDLLNDFDNLQLTELVKQVNMQSGTPIGSVGSNNPNNFETGEPSNPTGNTQERKNKNADNFRNKRRFPTRKTFINEEFKPKNPLQLEPVPAWGYFLNLDCVTDKRPTIDNWSYAIILSLMQEPIYSAEGRDVNAIYNLIIYSLQGIVRNWYNNLSVASRNIIEADVKNNLITSIEHGVWTFERYLIAQFQGYEFVEDVALNKLEMKRDIMYKLTNLRICNLCNYKSFFCEFDKYYYELYDSAENQEPYIQLLLNKFPHPWNKYFSEKFEIFAKKPTTFRSVAAVQTVVNREMMELCLQESRRRYIKEVTLCCENVNEPGQYGCENYPTFRPKRKRTSKQTVKKPLPRRTPKKRFSKKKNFTPKKTKTEKAKTEKSVNKPQKSSKHYRHENLTQEKYNPQNRYYKRSKKPTSCQCWNCGEIGHKSIDCTKRKANIVKLFSEEFEEIQMELYPIDINLNEVISSCYESVSSESEISTSDIESYSETDDEY